MFNNKKNLKSDYVSLFNNKTNQQPVPSGYPCTFDSDCASPAVCQFSVCTINIGGNETNDLANICKGKSIKDCAKEMQKEREKTEVPIYIPNYPSSSPVSSTGGTGSNGSSNVPSVNIKTSLCKYDKDCGRNEVCITGVCVDKSNFPLIARQKRLKSSMLSDSSNNNEMNKQNLYTINQSIGTHQMKTNGSLNTHDYMFLLESGYPSENNNSILNGLHDDYFYFNNK